MNFKKNDNNIKTKHFNSYSSKVFFLNTGMNETCIGLIPENIQSSLIPFPREFGTKDDRGWEGEEMIAIEFQIHQLPRLNT